MKIETAEFVISASCREQLVRDLLPEIAFVGRSNVGKSSLMNRLLGRRGLARTSRSPGRTRLVNYFLVNQRFYFVDLPGYGYAKVSRAERQRWGELMDEYLAGSHPARQLLLLVDGKVGATALDCQAFEYFQSLQLDPQVVATKIDKVPRSRRVRQMAAIRRQLSLPEPSTVVPFSAVSGEGGRELWKEISSFLGQRPRRPQPVEMT